jgi:hypothetical protein
MALKNYTTKVPASRSVQEIQEMLIKAGASGVSMEYEQGTGRIAGLYFQISFDNKKMSFKLPLQWREAQKVLAQEGNRKADDDDYAYRVAWRILRDWVDVQVALINIKQVQLQEVFLPYAMHRNGKTVYENMLENPDVGLLLGDGK